MASYADLMDGDVLYHSENERNNMFDYVNNQIAQIKEAAYVGAFDKEYVENGDRFQVVSLRNEAWYRDGLRDNILSQSGLGWMNSEMNEELLRKYKRFDFAGAVSGVKKFAADAAAARKESDDNLSRAAWKGFIAHLGAMVTMGLGSFAIPGILGAAEIGKISTIGAALGSASLTVPGLAVVQGGFDRVNHAYADSASERLGELNKKMNDIRAEYNNAQFDFDRREASLESVKHGLSYRVSGGSSGSRSVDIPSQSFVLEKRFFGESVV